MLSAIWIITQELAPWLFLGAAVAGVLHVLLPGNFIRRQLSGWQGIFKAVGIGVPLPLCSCGVIPAGLGLKKDGASDGAAIGFLISTPQTGVDSILVSAAFLGWPFALFKVVSAGLTGVIGGFLVEAVSTPAQVELADGVVESPSTKRGFKEGVEYSLDLLKMIWRWLVFGIIVSAALEVFVPQDFLATMSDWAPLTSVILVLGLSIPLYVCATSSVPIAAALVAGGMPVGLALVFLMAGPATNVATIGAVFRGFGGRVLSVYLAVVIIGSAGFGLAYDTLWGSFFVSQVEHHHHLGWGSMSLAGVLILLFVWFAYSDLSAWWITKTVTSTRVDTVYLDVEGMTCGACVAKLERALQAVDGIDSVNVTLNPGRTVVSGQVSRQKVIEVIKATGFNADSDS